MPTFKWNSSPVLALLAAFIAMALLFLTVSNAAPVTAQTPAGTPTPTPAAEQGDVEKRRDAILANTSSKQKYPNMDSSLNGIVERVETRQLTAQAAAASAPMHQEASVAVTLYVTEGYADEIWEWLKASGGDPRNIGADYIEAYIPVSLLPAASEREGVISIRTIIPSSPNQSAVVSEGAAAHGAPAWHAAGYKGQDVKIGVIDSFEGFSSLMGSELPSTVEARCYTDIGEFASNLKDCETGSEHGTAMAEAVFDIAPDGTYYISNPISRGDLKTAVGWMVAQDVDIVVYGDIWTWEGPGDGTTPFSWGALRSVDAAVEGGITWVSVAGNDARRTWFGEVRKSILGFFQNFEGTNFENHVNLKAGEQFRAQLRWEDTWGGATKNLDLTLWNSDDEIVASSNDIQRGDADDYPFEFLSYTPSADGTYNLTVSYIFFDEDEADPEWIQLQAWGYPHLEYHTLSGSIGNPAESANSGMLAVGAAAWDDTSTIRDFSSRGPTPDDRIKPDIVGADGVNSAIWEDWRGTSQASAHVAGLGALVKQRFPDYTPAQVANYLKDSAEARGDVPNNTWGYGFAKLPASDAATPTPEPTATSIPTPGATPEPTATPTPTAVPPQPEVLSRISALETLVATLQGLISTLEGKITALGDRVTTLEANASAPTPIPTATFTPTPTPAPGSPTPTSTVAPGVTTPSPTPPPTATATPITVACVTPITGDGTISASWIDTCQSTNRPIDPDKPDDGTYYARYYTFDISAPSTVTISLESSEDTFLYLLKGTGKTGSVAHFNDDFEYPVNSNSRIEQTLQAESYTIEAATYKSGIIGSSFTLTVSGIE